MTEKQRDLSDIIWQARRLICEADSLLSSDSDDVVEEARDKVSAANRILWTLGGDIRACEMALASGDETPPSALTCVVDGDQAKVGITRYARFDIPSQAFVPADVDHEVRRLVPDAGRD